MKGSVQPRFGVVNANQRSASDLADLKSTGFYFLIEKRAANAVTTAELINRESSSFQRVHIETSSVDFVSTGLADQWVSKSTNFES